MDVWKGLYTFKKWYEAELNASGRCEFDSAAVLIGQRLKGRTCAKKDKKNLLYRWS